MESLSGISWLLPAAGIVVLGLSLFFGMRNRRKGSPQADARSDRATTDLYRAEDRATEREEATGTSAPTREEIRTGSR